MKVNLTQNKDNISFYSRNKRTRNNDLNKEKYTPIDIKTIYDKNVSDLYELAGKNNVSPNNFSFIMRDAKTQKNKDLFKLEELV